MSVHATFHIPKTPPSTAFSVIGGAGGPGGDTFGDAKIMSGGETASFFVNPDQWDEFGSNLLDLGMALLKASRERTEARPTCSSEPSEPASS